jgi:hypothetical protein
MATESARVSAIITNALRESKSTKRHPCEVTADRIGDHLDKYPEDFDGATRDDVGHLRHILQNIADRERRR